MYSFINKRNGNRITIKNHFIAMWMMNNSLYRLDWFI
jgi:hypothetical protein